MRELIPFFTAEDKEWILGRTAHRLYKLADDIQSRCISMKVAKWGNSLAVRLPTAVVETLHLEEGDQIEIRIAGKREFEIARDRGTEKALERIRRLRRPLPPGFRFDRLEANER